MRQIRNEPAIRRASMHAPWQFLAAALVSFAVTAVHAATPMVAGGEIHALALKRDGTVVGWGDDRMGPVGSGRLLDVTKPAEVRGITSARVISAGLSHVAVLMSDGTVWTWGRNIYGQLGDGTTTDRFKPGPVPGLRNVVEIAAGGNHTLARTSDGAVWAWGLNVDGRIGDGTTTNRSSPTRVVGLSGVVALAASGNDPSGTGYGSGNSAAVAVDGSVWMWGTASFDRLGAGSTPRSSVPIRLPGIDRVTAISSGDGFTIALRADGSVWTWGPSAPFAGLVQNIWIPQPVPGLSGIVRISAGQAHAAAVDGNGNVWSWGSNRFGEIGNGRSGFGPDEPVQRIGVAGARDVAAGPNHTLALMQDGSLRGWGLNNHGQVGNGVQSVELLPVAVAAPGSFVSISTGGGDSRETSGASFGVRSDGAVLAWGDNGGGQLGDGTPLLQPAPISVRNLDQVTQVAAGGTSFGVYGGGHSLALRVDGSVWAWGRNATGQLGDGTQIGRSTPAPVPGIPPMTAIAAGDHFSLALSLDGHVWKWGQWGGGAPPSVVSQLQEIVRISAYGGSWAALQSDGTVWCDGLPGCFSTTRVPGLTDIVEIAVGDGFLLALRKDGTVWSMGSNSHGQLGDGTNNERSSPARIPSLERVTAIGAGKRSSMAVRSDGLVWAWGLNGEDVPAIVTGLSDAVQVSAGGTTLYALKRDGTVWAWGVSNILGTIGDGTFADRKEPVVVVHEDGAGSVTSDDWYLDLDPSVSGIIPSGKVPAFLAVAEGTVLGDDIGVTARVRFRTSDAGRAIHVFAYAPRVGLAAKDDGTCVLNQLSADGRLVPTNASNLAPYAANVAASQQQAVQVLNNVYASQVAGATFCIGTGNSGVDSVDPRNSVCVATIPGSGSCTIPSNAGSPAVDSPGPLSGLWWNAAESGWGVSFTQRRNILFAAWYTYDESGDPKWYVASSCAMPADASAGTCTGDLFEVSGPNYFGGPFDSSAVRVSRAGSLRVDFAGPESGSMAYTVAGQSRVVPITRQVFRTGKVPAINYTDLWWNPLESGWGLSVTHQSDVMFLAWYVYGGSGRPVWYVASSCQVVGTGCSGSLYRTTGPPWGPAFDSSRVRAIASGTVQLTFSDPNTGVLSYTVDGVSGTKVIQRQKF